MKHVEGEAVNNRAVLSWTAVVEWEDRAILPGLRETAPAVRNSRQASHLLQRGAPAHEPRPARPRP